MILQQGLLVLQGDPDQSFWFQMELFSDNFPFWFLDYCFKTTQNLANHENKSWQGESNWLAAKSYSWDINMEAAERLPVRPLLEGK